MTRIAVCAALLLGLAACGSSPTTRFYTLSVATEPARAAKLHAPLLVAAVHIPETLDREQIVSAAGPNQLDVSDQDRWSAPLGPMTRRVLSQDLQREFDPAGIIVPGAPAPPGTRRIVVTIEQFGRVAPGRVTLVGSWSLLRGAADTVVLHRPVLLETPVGDGVEQQVRGMSLLLSRLAEQIAGTMPK